MDPKKINYTFMKTGQDITNNEAKDPEIVKDVIALITTFSQNSILSADVYVKHANRKIITTKDIQMAMKLEVFEFVNRDNSKRLQKNRNEIEKDYNRMFTQNEDEENNEDNDDFDYEKAIDDLIENENENENEKEGYSKSKCECDICRKMNYIEQTWDYWQPKTNLEKILKIHISKIVESEN